MLLLNSYVYFPKKTSKTKISVIKIVENVSLLINGGIFNIKLGNLS